MNRWIALLPLVGAMACVSEQAGYDDVQRVVSSRTGRQAHWDHADGRSVAQQRTRELLARPLTADSAVQVALFNNPDLQASFEELGIARGELVHALRLPNPHVGGSLHFFGEESDPDIEVSLTLNITHFFFMPGRNGAARAELDAAALAVGGTALDLTLDVRRAFYGYVAARQSLELRRTVLLAAKASYDTAKELHEAGNLTDLDLDTERALYAESRLSVAESESQLVSERARLSSLLGLWKSERAWSTEPRLPEPTGSLPTLTTAEREALSRSIDLALAKRRFTAAAKRANLARAEGWIPELSAGVSAERDDEDWGFGPTAELEVPLFYQGQGEVGRARAQMRQQQKRHDATAIAIRNAVRAALRRAQVAEDRAKFYQRELLPLRQRIVEETQRQYNAMNTGAFRLLQAKRDQVESGRAYVETLREYWVARAELELLLSGRLVNVSAAADPGGSMPQSMGASDAH